MFDRKKLKVMWISAGVSSAIAAYLSKDVDKYIYIHIDDQHKDSLRFLKDLEVLLGRTIEIIQSNYKNVDQVQQQFQFINSAFGAKCTEVLKKRVRKEWEHNFKDYDITYIWGFDITEKHRADRLLESMPEFKHEFPLIDRQMTKEDSHGLLARQGIERPVMYDLGYRNNNCIGCVKGGMGYWNKIRVDFPERFKQQSERERQIGRSCLRDKNGFVFLDELDPKRGRIENEIMPDCGVMCQLNLD